MDDAKRLFPGAPQPWLDLSTGINPVGWQPRGELEADLGPLPTLEALRGLEVAAASFLGVSAARVAAVPGSEIALRMLPVLLDSAPITAVTPGYGTHAEIATEKLESHRLEEAFENASALLFANPGNPQGRVVAAPRMLEMASQIARRGGWLVVDEAFADASEDLSILPHLDSSEPVIVLRSFGKFFGLAGLRLGFVIAPPHIVSRVRQLLGDWPVSTPAILWGTQAYRDSGWIARTRTSLMEQAGELDFTLRRHGLVGSGGCPLFRLVEHRDATGLFLHLARAGILVRPFANQPTWLRFGLPKDGAALLRLDEALRSG